MDEQLLKDLVATAEADNYNWDVIMPKFPELSNYDLQLLKDYVATAEADGYNYETINAKFPEFKEVETEVEEVALEDQKEDVVESKEVEEVKLDEELFEERELFTQKDFARQSEEEDKQKASKYDIDTPPGKYYLNGDEIDREILKDKLFDSDFIEELQEGKVEVEIEGDEKLSSLAKKQKESGSRVFDLAEAIEAGITPLKNFGNASINMFEDAVVEILGYKPGNTQLALRAYRDFQSKNNIEKREKIIEKQREYEYGFIESIKNGNFSDAANIGFRTTAQSAPLMVISSIAAALTRGKSIPATRALIKASLTSSSVMSGILIPDEYAESIYSDDEKIKNLSKGDKLTRAFLMGTAEGVGEGIMGPVGSKGFSMFKSGMKDLVKQAFNVGGKEAAKKLSRELSKETAKEIFKTYGLSSVAEGGSEAFTSLAQDLTDDFYGIQDLSLEDYMSNAAEAGALGIFMGGVMGGPGVIAKTGSTLLRRNKVKQGAISEIRKSQDLGLISKKRGDELIKEIEELQDAVNQTDSSLSEENQNKIADAIFRKKQIEKAIEGLDPNQAKVKEGKKLIEELNNEISEISEATESDLEIAEKRAYLGEEISDIKLKKSINFLEEQGKKLGKKVYVVETDETGKTGNEKAQELYDEFVKENPGTESMDVTNSDAFKVGDIAVVNLDVAKQTGALSVGSHETLHFVLDTYLDSMFENDLAGRKKLIKDFKNLLSKEQLDVVNKRIEGNYLDLEGFDPETSVEWFNAFSDAIELGDISFDENIGNKILNFVQEIFRKVGIKKEFSNARQAYNFMKDYSKSISKGELSGRALKLSETKPTTETSSVAMSKSEATGLAKQYKKGSINPDKITDFIEQYHSLGLRAMKFDRSKGTIESDEAISFLNKEFESVMRNYDPSKGLEFSTYVNSVIPKRAVAFYEEQIGDKSMTTSTDSEQARQLEADDTPTKDNRTDKEIRQAERKGIKVREKIPKVYSIDNVVESVRAKAKNIKAKNLKQLKGTALEEVSMMIGRDKELGKSIFNKLSKNADLNKPEMLAIQNFINANVDLSIGSLIEGYTSEFKATGVVNKLLEKFYNKRSVRAKTGPGLQVQIKKPNINPTEFKEAFGILGNDRANWNQKVPSKKGGVSDILKGFVRNLDQVISSQEVREQLILDGKSEEALSTLKDGMPTGYFSKTAKSENLGKAFREIKNEDNKAIFLSGLSEFIERINIGQDVEASFIETYGDKFLTTGKNNKDTKVKENLIKEFDKVIKNSPQKQFDKKSLNKEDLNEYLYKAFEEQTDPRVDVQKSLGIDKDGVNFGDVKQIESFKNALLKIFKFNRSRFDSDLDFFKWALQHYETLTASAKIGSLPNHKWVKNLKGIWNLTEGKASGRGSGVRYGIFNNKNELLNVLLKPFDNSNSLTLQKGKGFFYDGVKIEINRAKQSKAATKFYLEEFLKTGELSNKTLTDSYNDAIGNQEEILRVLNFYKDNKGKKKGISKNDLGMYFMSSTGDMTSILRSAYPIDSISLSDSTNPNDYTFEHNPPVRVMKTYMAQYVNGQITESQLKEKFADASVSVIPDLMDIVINIRYKDTIPLAYVNRFSRYFNNFSIGKFPFKMTVYTPTIKNGKPVSWKKSIKGGNLKNLYESVQKAKELNKNQLKSAYGNFSKSSTNEEVIGYAKTVDEALAIARDPNAPVKKIRVFDFDDTLAQTKSIVFYTKPDGTEGQLTAEEFAEKGADLVAEGAVMDFSDFNIVRDGKRGPLFDIAKKIEKARGTEDVFVLTARAPESQKAIHEFLKSEGLNIPIENITGLGNSTGAAKANWIVNKAADGYNDFYFADDAYQNVKAVQDALSQLDVKSKVQQAKVKFSKTVNEDFNKIIEQKTGIASEKRYSRAKAKVRGAGKGNKKFFIPYSAEDFMGLIYPLLSKGTLGDSQMAWFKEHLLDPYARAMENVSRSRINLLQDFKALKKGLEIPKNLRKKNESGFTNEQAVRVYLFNKTGNTAPGLSKTDMQELIDVVNSDGLLKAFADQILNLTKGDGYAKPGNDWLAGTITTDLLDVLNNVKRAKYLEQSGFTKNAELIFSEENLNKLEAAYGEKYRESMENILKRMKSGKNRLFSGNKLSNRVLDYINGSIGAIMFLNTRTAVLQTISNINFLNWSFNNPIKAGKAFANQKQYWKDFMELMNSDYLVDRRNGLKININENEIADAAATSKNKGKAVMSYILQKGFLPTQFADSFAIASGGATFYRNRINDLIKNEGLTEAEAKEKAMLEFRQVAETSQQSSDPSKISAQQASDLGRVVLAFNNTPMQYARLQKRAIQDLVNGRGDAKTNVSRIIYYGVVQNLIFNVLQQALFALGAGDDEDEMSNEEKEKYEETKQKKYTKIANGMLDSLLRGLGVAGLTTSVVKNFLLDVYERSGRKRPEYVDAVYKLLQISPPISSKISKVRQAAYQFDSKKRREEIFEKGFSLDNPAYEAASKVISATTNLPLDRLYNKANNIEAALAEDTEAWQTVAMLAGWPEWQIKPKDKKKEVSKFDKGNVKVEKIEDPKPIVIPKYKKAKKVKKFSIK